MAEGQGIQWGKMIKGAVKITATVAVIVGVVALTGIGVAAIPGAEGTIGAQAATVGAAVTAAVTGATESVANALATPINGIVNMFTGGNEAVVGGTEVADRLSVGDGVTVDPETLNTTLEGVRDKVTGLTNNVDGQLKDAGRSINQAIVDLDSTSSSVDASALEKMHSQVMALNEALEKASEATPETALDLYNTVLEKAELLSLNEGALKVVEGNVLTASGGAVSEATKAVAEQLDIVRDTVGQTISQVNDIHGDLKEVFEPLKLANAPKAWAAVGAAGVGLGAAKAVGRAQGQREVMGAFTKAEMDRRGAAARMTGQGV